MSLRPRRPKNKRGKPLEIRPWPGPQPLDSYAERAEYVGSPEHKDYVNPILQEAPRPRAESDASRCEEFPREAWPRFTSSLRTAIRMGCVSDHDAEGWPRHVWGYHDGRLFQARHRTDPPGSRYKGWWIEWEERPKDPMDRLGALRAELERDDS